MSEDNKNTRETIISIKEMNKFYGDFQALSDINLDVKVWVRKIDTN
jgi:ABC-type phosphate transport system ATPase subunit